MADTIKSSHSGPSYLLRRAKSAAPHFRYKSASMKLQPNHQDRTVAGLYVDEKCPMHGSQANVESNNQNTETIQQQVKSNHGSTNDLASTSIQAFHNNPGLGCTQRDVVGNNLQFPQSARVSSWNNVNAEQYGAYVNYRDAIRRNLTTLNRSQSFRPKVHFGRSGGHWSHIKQTNTYSGSNLLFIDGTVRPDSVRYPPSYFGYPTMGESQYNMNLTRNQDLPYVEPNLTAKSLDVMTWSATDQLNCRPSISQYSNRYERHAKENYVYWPADINYQKPKCKPLTTGTYKTWLGLSDAVLKL